MRSDSEHNYLHKGINQLGCDIHPHLQIKRDGVWIDSGQRVNLYRSYVSFGMLAGVRRDDIPVIPAATPGLPEQHVFQNEVEISDGDGHSHHHTLLSDLLLCKSMSFELSGFLSIEAYKELKEQNKPTVYYDDRDEDNPPLNVTIISVDEADKYIKLSLYANDFEAEMKDKGVYTTWQCSYADVCESFWNEIDTLIEVSQVSPEEMMLVYWFDN